MLKYSFLILKFDLINQYAETLLNPYFFIWDLMKNTLINIIETKWNII